MFEELFEAAGEAGAKGLSWEQELPEDERELLPIFESWLQSAEGKSESTAKAYRNYVAQAMVKLRKGEEWKKLSTDVRSGVNAFIRFAAALKEAELAFLEAETRPEDAA